jgi:hemolysin activation/secretion protein
MQRNDKTTLVAIPPISTAVLLINLTASGLSAQVIPTAGDFDRQIQTSSNDNNFASTALPDLQKVVIEPPLTALPGGPSIVVSRIAIVGNRALSLDVLTPVISSAFGTRMTLADLEELALSVTRFYRTKGYFVARAYIPAQEIVDGVVTFRIVEGNYGDFILENSSLVKDKIAQSILDDVKVYDIVSLDTLERAMLIANDTPGVTVVRADVMPGEAIGTSDFIV